MRKTQTRQSLDNLLTGEREADHPMDGSGTRTDGQPGEATKTANQHRKTRHEQIFAYDMRRNDQRSMSVGSGTKRQLTTTGRISNDGIENQEGGDEEGFMYITKGAKRKSANNDNSMHNSHKERITHQSEMPSTRSTMAKNNNGRLFVNSKNRTSKNGGTEYGNSDQTPRYPPRTDPERSKFLDQGQNERNGSGSYTPILTPGTRRAVDTDRDEQEMRGSVAIPHLDVSKHALQYAVEHHMPSLLIACQPKIKEQSVAKAIVKEILKYIEKDFRQLNKNYKSPLGFDFWYINKEGDLVCYTQLRELYIFLLEPSHYPGRIAETEVTPRRPYHLPAQNTVVLKFVPAYITEDEIRTELGPMFQSIFRIEDMRGSRTEKARHVRLELTSTDEYERILRNGSISIDGQLIEAQEFLAPPRLLMCGRCNDPGHVRKNCNLGYEACRRCGKDRTEGSHDECKINCHRCQQEHLATDYKCPYLVEYRRSLLARLKENPNLLPPNVRFFIPTDYRDRTSGNTKILANPREVTSKRNGNEQQKNRTPFHLDSHAWPQLATEAGTGGSTNPESRSIWDEMKSCREEIDTINKDLEQKLRLQKTTYNEHLRKMNGIMLNVSHQAKKQSEAMERCYTTINEVLPILTTTLEVLQHITKRLPPVNDNGENERALSAISHALHYVKDRNELLVTNQRNLNLLTEHQSQLLTESINSLIVPDE